MSCPHLDSAGILFIQLKCGITHEDLSDEYVKHMCGDNHVYPTCPYNKTDSGGCFITTAVLTTLGKPDDCEELQSMRRVRDTWLVNQPDGPELIAEYYATAPGIVKAIDRRNDRFDIYAGIYHDHLVPCLAAVDRQDYDEARRIYLEMFNNLRNTYGAPQGEFRSTNAVDETSAHPTER